MTASSTSSRLARKRVEGVQPSKLLVELLDEAFLAVSQVTNTTTRDSALDPQTSSSPVLSRVVTNDNTTDTHSSNHHHHHQRPEEQIAALCRPLDTAGATRILRDWKIKLNIEGNATTSDQIKWIPIPVIRAMESLLDPGQRKQLEDALHQTSIVFTPSSPPADTDPSKERFRKRMDRLRLQNEETKYSKLTKNLNLVGPADDVTTRSMTYAASIGLNMIVAPLSFGCFMYFFAGGIFDYFWTNDTSAPRTQGPDIKRVIVAVVSGVVMLFIEMILFVIRTHEMDEAMRKKAKKAKPVGPFGFYSSRTSKTYQE